MLLTVRKFISVEMIRDGGSFALEFESCDGNRYILFIKIRLAECGPAKEDQHRMHQERELEGYDAPIIIDCDPAKRPQNTDHIVYSVLCGPQSPITWDQARQIMGEAARLAQSLSAWGADWLQKMRAIVESNGEPPPGSQRRSIWSRPS
jgi:hypothetical protein